MSNENQKKTTDEYRKNWERIFSIFKKPPAPKKEKDK